MSEDPPSCSTFCQFGNQGTHAGGSEQIPAGNFQHDAGKHDRTTTDSKTVQAGDSFQHTVSGFEMTVPFVHGTCNCVADYGEPEIEYLMPLQLFRNKGSSEFQLETPWNAGPHYVKSKSSIDWRFTGEPE